MRLGGSRSSKAVRWLEIRNTSNESTQPRPAPRSSHSLCYDYRTNKYFLFGGQPFDPRVYILKISESGEMSATWAVLRGSGETPGHVTGHASVLYQDHMYVFGGQNEDEEYRNSIHRINIRTGVWELITCQGKLPQPRSHHSGTRVDKRWYIFGGENRERKFGDFYCFDLEKKTWRQMMTKDTIPSPCTSAGLYGMRNTNDDGDLICLICGASVDPNVTVVFNYSSKTCEWYRMTSCGDVPSPSNGFGACLMIAGEMLVIGGRLNSSDRDSQECSNDCYIYKLFGGHWTKLKVISPQGSPESVPPARFNMACARAKVADFSCGSFIIFGGNSCTGEPLCDVWLGKIQEG